MKNANANTKMRKQPIVFYVWRFPQKTEGSTDLRLLMVFETKKKDKNVV
jgi:hypothetical protein